MTSLTFVLRLNAASCLGFGLLFAAFFSETAWLLGTMPPIAIQWLGFGLLLNGAHLLLASGRRQPVKAEILWFALGDMVWWLASLALIGAGVWITTATGVWLAGLVASFVAGMGAAQAFLLGMTQSGLTARGQWQRIGRSWQALPLWVKLWLTALNAVFLAAPAFLTWDAARIVLIGYLASGPVLLAFAGFAGGLTRHMGIAHLLAFTPMLVWLASEQGLIDRAGPGFAFGALFAGIVAVCLAFDLYDLVRWLRGERGIIGPKAKSLRPAI